MLAHELLDALLFIALTDQEDSLALSYDTVIDPLDDDQLLLRISIERNDIALSLIEESLGVERNICTGAPHA